MAERLAWAWVFPGDVRINWRAHIVGRCGSALCGFDSIDLVPVDTGFVIPTEHICRRCLKRTRSRYGRRKEERTGG